ncbi:glycosyltransferase [Paraglaciecola hydrolytica]|uniref:Glycosyltransferase 2-like domain-containing protein n=1 Tax=Paraglaciecola hydrolytica TaxID=1799789 RepID=A0A135ZZA9_9ALTE|nr:glycosyltransferase [Paraglaciecola hydrolytica]KXI28315.1 hypothetical protein AX660_18270 [Paraglaciecola hydrolytica]
MGELTTSRHNFSVSQLSSTNSVPTWYIAVFAHNEAKNIGLALDSIVASTQHKDVAVFVLANGCKDATTDVVRAKAATVNNLYLLETDFGDKANAWNLFVHDVLPHTGLKESDSCFFMDGDVTCSVNTFSYLASALYEAPRAEAAGAMPATGRDRDAWRQRMTANGMLAGNCYALRSSFVLYLQQQQVRIPIGLIGEDFFVSWLVASNVWRNDYLDNQGMRCIFHSRAEFSFRSLSLLRPSDYRLYLRRKWRYTLRGIQHQMLMLLMRHRLGVLPTDVEQLYKTAPLPSRLVWCGFDTPLRTLAVHLIRKKSFARH